jgi:hypothetical protein
MFTSCLGWCQVPSGHPLLSRDVKAVETAGELRFQIVARHTQPDSMPSLHHSLFVLCAADHWWQFFCDECLPTAYRVQLLTLSRQSSYYRYPARSTLRALRRFFPLPASASASSASSSASSPTASLAHLTLYRENAWQTKGLVKEQAREERLELWGGVLRPALVTALLAALWVVKPAVG